MSRHSPFDGRNWLLAVVVGLGPFLYLAFVVLANPRGFGGPFDPPSEAVLAQQRIQFVILAFVSLLAVAGAVGLYRARSTRDVLSAFFLLTVPALILAVYGPGVVIILTSHAS